MKPPFFLDLDGVLALPHDWGNPDRSRYPHGPAYGFDPTCLRLFNEACEAVDAEIVLSSSWRMGHDLEGCQRLLRDRGVTAPVVGMTPNGYAAWPYSGLTLNYSRGDEIALWLQQAEEGERGFVARYAIIDDSRDAFQTRKMPAFRGFPCRIKTKTDLGFTEGHAQRLVSWFTREVKP